MVPHLADDMVQTCLFQPIKHRLFQPGGDQFQQRRVQVAQGVGGQGAKAAGFKVKRQALSRQRLDRAAFGLMLDIVALCRHAEHRVKVASLQRAADIWRQFGFGRANRQIDRHHIAQPRRRDVALQNGEKLWRRFKTPDFPAGECLGEQQTETAVARAYVQCHAAGGQHLGGQERLIDIFQPPFAVCHQKIINRHIQHQRRAKGGNGVGHRIGQRVGQRFVNRRHLCQWHGDGGIRCIQRQDDAGHCHRNFGFIRHGSAPPAPAAPGRIHARHPSLPERRGES